MRVIKFICAFFFGEVRTLGGGKVSGVRFGGQDTCEVSHVSISKGDGEKLRQIVRLLIGWWNAGMRIARLVKFLLLRVVPV